MRSYTALTSERLLACSKSPPGATVVGSRRRYGSDFMGKRVENVYVVRTFDPNRRLVVETTPESALAATSDIRWEAVASGTRVTMTVDGRPKGALRFLPRLLVEATFEREAAAALVRLKDLLETGD